MKIGIIGASEDEIIPFVEHIINKKSECISGIKYHVGKYEKTNVVAVNCTSCKKRASLATEILIDKYNVTHILISGVAAKVSSMVEIGDTVVATEIAVEKNKSQINKDILYNKSDFFLCDNNLIEVAKYVVDNNIFSQNILFGSIESHENLKIVHSQNTILCSDFESSSIAKVCVEKSIPFISIRTVINDKDFLNNSLYEMKRITAAYTSLSFVNRMFRVKK